MGAHLDAGPSGDAYDPGNVQVGFAAFTGYMGGFASSYGTIDFKVKGLPTGEIEVKFFGGDGGDGSADNAMNYNVTTYAGSTALGNGWYQVSIPVSDFADTVDINEGFLLGPPGDHLGLPAVTAELARQGQALALEAEDKPSGNSRRQVVHRQTTQSILG